MIQYLVHLYVLAVGYFYPLTRFVMDYVSKNTSISSLSTSTIITIVTTDETTSKTKNLFRPQDWSVFFATLIIFTIFDTIVGPLLSIVLFPWYPFMKIAFVSALIHVQDFDMIIFSKVSNWIMSHASLINNLELSAKNRISFIWKYILTNFWDGSFFVYNSVRNVTQSVNKKKAF